MPEELDISTLNRLLEICRDAEMGFWAAAEHVQDPGLKQLFQKIARTRGHYADELKAEIRRHGGAVDEGGSFAGSMHRRWMDVKGLVGRDDASIVAEAARGEQMAVRAYASAMQQALPAATRAIVARQHAAVKDDFERVSALEREWKQRRQG